MRREDDSIRKSLFAPATPARIFTPEDAYCQNSSGLLLQIFALSGFRINSKTAVTRDVLMLPADCEAYRYVFNINVQQTCACVSYGKV